MAKQKPITSPLSADIKHALRFAVDSLPRDADLLIEFPELAAYEEFTQFEPSEQRDKWLRYVMYCFDAGSWFVRTIRSLEDRKEWALKAAEINEEETVRVFDPVLKDGEKRPLDRMITRFFRIQNNLELEYYLSGQEMLRQAMENIRSGVSGIADDKEVSAQRNKITVFKEMRSVLNDLKELEKTLFKGDEALKEMILDVVIDSNRGFVEELYGN